MSHGITEIGQNGSEAYNTGITVKKMPDVAALEQQLKEANFISRFMAAISSSLDPHDICAIASRHLYDFAPFNRIVFCLSSEFGLPSLVIAPGKSEDGRDVLVTGPATARCKGFKIDDMLQGSLYIDPETGGTGIRLVLPDELGRVQVVFSAIDRQCYTSSVLSEVMAHFAQTLKNALTHVKVKEMAMKDSLTGLFNRRVFDELLAVEVRRKELLPISLLLIDLDDFKRVNDTYGHPAGDEVLATVGRILREGTRGSDLVARYGGEEFAIMLPATTAATAFEIAQRLRSRLASTLFVFNGQHLKLTASIGISYTSGAKTDSIPQIVSRADQALYRAKKSGKNMSYIYTCKSVALNKKPEVGESAFAWLRTA